MLPPPARGASPGVAPKASLNHTRDDDSRARIKCNHTLDGPSAHGTEADFVPCEHDAVRLGTVVALGLVEGPLEGADLPRMGPRPQKRRHLLALLPEEGLHLRFRPFLRADLAATSLDFVLL